MNTLINVWKWNLLKASECARKSDTPGYNHYMKNVKDIEAQFPVENNA